MVVREWVSCRGGRLSLEGIIACIAKSLPEAGIGSGWLGAGALYRGAMAFWGVCLCVVAILRLWGRMWGGLWFSCGMAQCGRALVSLFQHFSAGVGGIWRLGGEDWALGYNFMKF